jgi:hypothetical protein
MMRTVQVEWIDGVFRVAYNKVMVKCQVLNESGRIKSRVAHVSGL